MTAPAPEFGTYVPPTNEEGDQYPPKDNYGKALLVKVLRHKEGIVTANSPEGAPGVIVELAEIGVPKTYRDVLWMGGAVVDGLKSYVGQILVLKFEPRQSKSGRTYPSPVNGDPADIARAQAHYAQIGDPFVPQFAEMNNGQAPAPTATAPQAAPAAQSAQAAAPAAIPPTAQPAAGKTPLTAEAFAALAAAGTDMSPFVIG